MVVKLKVMHGPSAGKEIKIQKTPFVIGRSDECHLRPKSDAISRRHCEIHFVDTQVVIHDLGSKNGTLVNGDRVEGKRTLKMGDHLKVGPLEFEVVIEIGLVSDKRPKVASVKDAAMRSGDSGFGDADVSSWLDEGDLSSKVARPVEAETRQFKLEETDRMALNAAANPATQDGSNTKTSVANEEATLNDAAAKEAAKKKEKEYGKLPTRPEATASNSREAAADALKKFFNRR